MATKSKTLTSGEPIAAAPPTLEYHTLAVELLRALRGRRSCAAFSRRLGYRSNVVHRWETGRAWPSAARYLQIRLQTQRGLAAREVDCFTSFFLRRPSWLDTCAADSPEAVSAFLRQLRGKTPIGKLAEFGPFSRFQLSRWLSGKGEPSLPEFLCLVELMSRRLLDLVAVWADPARLPSVAERWRELEAARRIGYEQPWSHAVLRALEMESQPRGAAQLAWLAERLGVPKPLVERCLELLAGTGQVVRQRQRWVPREVTAITTARDPALARQLKLAWARSALERLEQGKPGNFGYSVFAVSRKDLRLLRDLHLEYVRAMQQVIARSHPNECVGLFCVQLLDLGERGNALAP